VPESNARRLAAYSFLVVFANDGTIDAAELAMLERLTLEDRQVDDREREVLANIFARADSANLAPEVRAEIQDFKTRYGIA